MAPMTRGQEIESVQKERLSCQENMAMSPSGFGAELESNVIRVLTKRNCLMIGPVWRRHIEQLSAVPEAVSVPGPTTETERTGT